MAQLAQNDQIRNIAIIAHVDHGKTTLVDQMFRQSGTMRAGAVAQERIMDNMDLERERGITIAAKNCSVLWKGVKINIVDTPGHADFGGEVERALMMVDGAILLVDAAEGPLPQTRFVLKKALERGLSMIVCINKIDRSDQRAQQVLNEVYSLFIDLDAGEDQLDFPVLFTIGRDGVAQSSVSQEGKDLSLLFETIVEAVPAPFHDQAEPFQMSVANLGYSDYLGRLAIGRVVNGRVRSNDQLVRIDRDGELDPLRVVNLQSYQGVKLGEISEAAPGEIIVLAGIEQVEIGDTICTRQSPKALPRLHVDEPTVAMSFCVNTSPFAGKEGKFLQSRRIEERLKKEILYNVGLQIEKQDTSDGFLVKGRGEFQIAILIETMRREGFELAVGRPQVIFKEQDGKVLEPIEHLLIDCDEAFIGIVTEKLSSRKGRMVNMINHGSGRVRIEYSIPSRSLIGYRNQFLSDTKGTGLMNSFVDGYEEYRGDFASRNSGSLLADRFGVAVAYAIFNLEPRGRMFVVPGDPVYPGMIVGEHCRDNDLAINICRAKKLSNMRTAGKDENIILTPVAPMTLEWAISFIRDDELVEVTPKSIRLRKSVLPNSKV